MNKGYMSDGAIINTNGAIVGIIIGILFACGVALLAIFVLLPYARAKSGARGLVMDDQLRVFIRGLDRNSTIPVTTLWSLL
jgi:hypothetical protein